VSRDGSGCLRAGVRNTLAAGPALPILCVLAVANSPAVRLGGAVVNGLLLVPDWDHHLYAFGLPRR
jgi:hypothetical protein